MLALPVGQLIVVVSPVIVPVTAYSAVYGWQEQVIEEWQSHSSCRDRSRAERESELCGVFFNKPVELICALYMCVEEHDERTAILAVVVQCVG